MDELIAFVRQQLTRDLELIGDPRGYCDGGVHLSDDRWRAEVEAKRRILDRLFDDWGMCREDIASGTAQPVLALLAQPYAGREGWREEWRA